MTLKDRSLAPKTQGKERTLAEVVESADDEEAMRLYTLLQARLQNKLDVSKLNLTEALGVQFQQSQRFVDEILHDKDIPANQRAQAMNAARASLDKIIEMRAVVYSQERQKKYELAFVKAVQSMGETGNSMMAVFMDIYGEYLNDRGE